jgi:hypothetical protein
VAAQRRALVPERLSFAFEKESEHGGFWSLFSAPLRWDWYYRIPIQLTVAGVVVLGVIALPYVGELLPKKDASVKIGALPSDRASFDAPAPTPPLPAPSEGFDEAGQPIVESLNMSEALDQAFPLDRRSSRLEIDVEKAIPLPQAKRPAEVAKADTAPPAVVPVAPVAPTAPVLPSPVASSSQQSEVSESRTVETSPPTPGVSNRAFFRWGARAQDPDLLASRVQRLLDSYRAVRAGELEWGANYRGGRYFHFTLSQGDYARFQEEIRDMEFTAFTAEQVKSDRDEKPGSSRVVFWIGPSP